MTSGELVGLLGPLRPRVKLVTVSACESAERVAHQQLKLLVPVSDADADSAVADPAGSATALATELARRLGCAVIGMRYPVTESFAATFARGE